MKKFTLFLIILLSGISATLFAQGVDFEIRNQQVINGGTQFQFEVYMAADVAGTFHSRGQVYIKYDTTSFGTSVVANGKITVDTLQLVAELFTFSGSPKYQTLNVVDNAGDIIAVTWQTNFPSFPPGTTFHTEVPTTMAPVYRYTIDIKNAGSNNVEFNRNLMFSPSQQFYLVSAGNEFPYNDASLPVEFLSFDANKLNNKEVLLNWATATELNNDYFVVEKMKDNGSFQAIGQVKGAGTTSDHKSYDFLDTTPMGALNAYRLRQVDFDGAVSFSEVVEVSFEGFANNLVVYPSPARDFTYVRSDVPLESDFQVQLINLNGQVLSTTELTRNSPDNQVKIDLSNMSEGMYIIRLQNSLGETTIRQIMKLSN